MSTVPEAPNPAALPRLYDAGDLAELFGVVRYTILQWAKNGTLPPGRRFGRVLRWTYGDLRPLLGEREGTPARPRAGQPGGLASGSDPTDDRPIPRPAHFRPRGGGS
jgi:hypothetical protein